MIGDVLKGIASILWPLTVAAALYGFRDEVRALLRRLRRFSKGTAEFDEVRLSAQLSATPIEQALREAAPTDAPPPTYIVERVTALRQELATLHADSDERRINLLLRRLAEEKQATDFQFIWLNIFGSQLEVLEAMTAARIAIDLTPYFSVHSERYKAFAASRENPQPPITFEAWAAFFSRVGIATITDRMGEITDKGADTLAFAVRRNLPRFQAL
jgi:hypothetical protein